MNGTIILNTLRQRYSSPLLIIVVVLLAGLAMLINIVMGARSLPNPDSLFLVAWIFGTGIIGKEMRSGVLQLVFVRPVTRSSYVWSKYFALIAGIFAFVFILWIVSCILIMRDSELTFQNAFKNLADHMIWIFGVCSVIVFLSSLRGGHTDFGLMILISLMNPLFRLIGTEFSMPGFVRASSEVERFLSPHFSVEMFGGNISWFSLSSYFSTITLCLALAIVILNRKELSYAE